MASTPLPSTPSTSTTANWICRACKDSEDVEVDLQQMGGEMVCPLCATVDAHASSVVGHVDVSEITGQIVDDASTHQSMDRSRMFSGDWNEKRYIVSLSPSASVQRKGVQCLQQCRKQGS